MCSSAVSSPRAACVSPRPNPVAIGDVLRIALHCGTETEPLIVIASVIRDDGDDEAVLAFQNL